jgi:hypothetical protein
VATPNPPYGAVFTYSVGQAVPADSKLVLNITDDAGRAVRRMEVPREAGLHRAAWNLRADPAPAEAGRGGRGGVVAARPADGDDAEQEQEAPGFGRGQAQGQVVAPGRYRATLAKVTGETVTPIGEPRSFAVVPLPR